MHPIRHLVLMVLLGAAALPIRAAAEFTCPDPGTVLFPGVSGTALVDSLRIRFLPAAVLDYGAARDVMFTRIDNDGGMVTCPYTGFSAFVDPASTSPRADALAAGLNTEHTWPQSKGAENSPMRSNLHHLFPSEIGANSARESFPFDEIPDAQTDSWYRLRNVVASPDPGLIDEYSELDRAHPDPAYTGRWEVREDRQGDIARGMFYFYTMYRSAADAADPKFFNVQKDALRAWHHADPVDDREYERTCAIAPHQSDRVNPFVIDPTLVDRAYFGGTPVRLARFTAGATAAGVALAWETAAEVGHAGFHVIRVRDGVEERLTAGLLTGGPSYRFIDRAGRPRLAYDYWLEAVGRDGSRERFGPERVRFPEVRPGVAVSPNPARSGEPVRIEIAGTTALSASLFDASGRRVRVWPGAAALQSGWDGRLDSGEPAPPGLYFLRVVTTDGTRTVRIAVIG